MIKKTFLWIKLIVGASIQFETWWFQNKREKLNSSQGFSMIFTLQGIFGARDKKKFRVKLKQSWIFWIRAELELHRRIPATRIAARSVVRRPTPTTTSLNVVDFNEFGRRLQRRLTSSKDAFTWPKLFNILNDSYYHLMKADELFWKKYYSLNRKLNNFS